MPSYSRESPKSPFNPAEEGVVNMICVNFEFRGFCCRLFNFFFSSRSYTYLLISTVADILKTVPSSTIWPAYSCALSVALKRSKEVCNKLNNCSLLTSGLMNFFYIFYSWFIKSRVLLQLNVVRHGPLCTTVNGDLQSGNFTLNRHHNWQWLYTNRI